jgi:pullulanase/glycogen debranching enzyme
MYDINVYAAPQDSTMAERVRMQAVGLSTVLLGQGVPFLHAGSDLLRSKSLDRNSYNSGDWFNRLDFTYAGNNFGVGLPPQGSNGGDWDVMRPLLADPNLKAGQADISFMAALTRELLEIRYSSSLFRLQTAEDVKARLAFLNTGPDQLPGLIVMTLADDLTGAPDLDKHYERLVVLINANDEAQTFTPVDLAGKKLALHPLQRASVDPVVKTAAFDSLSGAFTVPGRTAAVFVEYERPAARINHLIDMVRKLVTDGVLNNGQGNSLITKLRAALSALGRNQPKSATSSLNAFVNEVISLVNKRVIPAELAEPLVELARDIAWQITNDL